jgi:hypothetical protein
MHSLLLAGDTRIYGIKDKFTHRPEARTWYYANRRLSCVDYGSLFGR